MVKSQRTALFIHLIFMTLLVCLICKYPFSFYALSCIQNFLNLSLSSFPIDFDCILTSLSLQRLDKNKFNLSNEETLRTENILKRALDVEKGVAEKPDLTEEHPDGCKYRKVLSQKLTCQLMCFQQFGDAVTNFCLVFQWTFLSSKMRHS